MQLRPWEANQLAAGTELNSSGERTVKCLNNASRNNVTTSTQQQPNYGSFVSLRLTTNRTSLISLYGSTHSHSTAAHQLVTFCFTRVARYSQHCYPPKSVLSLQHFLFSSFLSLSSLAMSTKSSRRPFIGGNWKCVSQHSKPRCYADISPSLFAESCCVQCAVRGALLRTAPRRPSLLSCRS